MHVGSDCEKKNLRIEESSQRFGASFVRGLTYSVPCAHWWATLGRTGYVRDRDKEFIIKGMDKVPVACSHFPAFSVHAPNLHPLGILSKFKSMSR